MATSKKNRTRTTESQSWARKIVTLPLVPGEDPVLVAGIIDPSETYTVTRSQTRKRSWVLRDARSSAVLGEFSTLREAKERSLRYSAWARGTIWNGAEGALPVVLTVSFTQSVVRNCIALFGDAVMQLEHMIREASVEQHVPPMIPWVIRDLTINALGAIAQGRIDASGMPPDLISAMAEVVAANVYGTVDPEHARTEREAEAETGAEAAPQTTSTRTLPTNPMEFIRPPDGPRS